MDRSVLATKPLVELKTIAADLRLRGFQRLRKADLVDRIVAATNGTDIPQSRREPVSQPQLEPVAQPVLEPATAGAPGEAGDRPAGVAPDQPALPNGDRRVVRTRTRTTANGLQDAAGTEQPTADAAERASGPQQESMPEPGHEAGQESGPEPSLASEPGESADQPRTRVRTRNRERGETEAAPAAQPGSGNGGRSQRGGAGVEQPPAAPAASPAPVEAREAGDGQRRGPDELESRAAPPAGIEDEEEDGRRRRRSRRERRRNKGGPQGPGGGPVSQVTSHPRQARHADEDSGAEPGEIRAGVLDVLPEGYGFLRTSGYLPGDRDVYVSQGQIRKHGLRRGDVVEGPIRAQRSNEKVPALHHVDAVNGVRPDENGALPHRPDFKDMTPLFPDERLRLETPDGPISMRIMDLISPIGKGQRGLIVSPPKAGKTTILKELGQAIAYNNPECHLMVVLVDERPEEVTDMQRSIPGEVIASTFDRPADDHTQIAELAMERAKRLVEQGRDVVILLDSITRLARAYNLSAPASGRIMSGGVDSTALYPPKRFFGAARNIERGGSLTIIASALIETGSKMDEVIFEEFKGTGNMEIRLDRRLEQKRIFPAIDIEASGTRKEELLLDRDELTIIWKLRRVLHALEGPASLELLIDKMRSTRSNNQFLVQIQKSNLQT